MHLSALGVDAILGPGVLPGGAGQGEADADRTGRWKAGGGGDAKGGIT